MICYITRWDDTNTESVVYWSDLIEDDMVSKKLWYSLKWRAWDTKSIDYWCGLYKTKTRYSLDIWAMFYGGDGAGNIGLDGCLKGAVR